MIIVGVTGKAGAGKGKVVSFFTSKGYSHFSVRDFLLKEIEKRNMPAVRDSAIKVANLLRREKSPSYLIEQVYEEAKKQDKNIIIESLRTPAEVAYLKSIPHSFLIAIDAPQNIRYERIKNRNGNFDKISFEQFADEDTRESASKDPSEGNIEACIKLADFVVQNDGTVDELNGRLEQIFERLDKVQ